MRFCKKIESISTIKISDCEKSRQYPDGSRDGVKLGYRPLRSSSINKTNCLSLMGLVTYSLAPAARQRS